MKFLIILAMTVVASSPSPTSSLLQQAQPLIDEAFVQINAGLAADNRVRNSAEAGFQVQLVNAMRDHVIHTLKEIDSVTAASIGVLLQNFTSRVETAQQRLNQALRSGQSVKEAAVCYWQVIHDITNTATLLGSSGSNYNNSESAELTDELKAVVHDINYLKTLIKSLGLKETIEAAIIEVLGKDLGKQLIGSLSLNRGLIGSLWGGITGVTGAVWNGITGVTSVLVNQIASLASSTLYFAGDKLNLIRQIATSLVSGGVDAVAGLGQVAAQQLLDQIAPYYNDLGLTASTVVSLLLTSYTGLVIPPSIIQAVGGNIIG